MQVVQHKAVRLNIEALLLRLSCEQAEMFSNQRGVVEARNSILRARGEEIPLMAQVGRAGQPYIFSPEIHVDLESLCHSAAFVGDIWRSAALEGGIGRAQARRYLTTPIRAWLRSAGDIINPKKIFDRGKAPDPN
jgi:hypothetical protein